MERIKVEGKNCIKLDELPKVGDLFNDVDGISTKEVEEDGAAFNFAEDTVDFVSKDFSAVDDFGDVVSVYTICTSGSFEYKIAINEGASEQ